jgi:hypothetical protein
MSMPLPRKITIGEKYDPAMEVKTVEEARAYFERLVEHSMMHGLSKEEAERNERINLGYYAGYYDLETRERVEWLYGAVHPIFGNQQPTAEEAFEAGLTFGKESKSHG